MGFTIVKETKVATFNAFTLSKCLLLCSLSLSLCPHHTLFSPSNSRSHLPFQALEKNQIKLNRICKPCSINGDLNSHSFYSCLYSHSSPQHLKLNHPSPSPASVKTRPLTPTTFGEAKLLDGGSSVSIQLNDSVSHNSGRVVQRIHCTLMNMVSIDRSV